MNFSKEVKKENYFLSQPHQPFFVLGIANAFIMLLIFALSYKGILSLNLSSLNFHVYTIVFLVFTNIFTGFLFTTFPRFCQDKVIEKSFYSNIFYANVLGSLLFILGSFMGEIFLHVGVATLFGSQLLIVLKLHTIFKNGTSPQKEDPYWILIGQCFGILAHFLFILTFLGLGVDDYAIKISFYMYLVFLTFAVGQRMIPMFSHSFAKKDKRFISTAFILFIAKTTLSIFNTNDYVKMAEIVVDLLLGVYILGEILKWKLKPLSAPAILWVLQLGLFWLPVAMFFSAISLGLELFLGTSFYYLGVHLLAIGFLTTILIGFGTRVTLGHSGQAPHADKFVTGLFYFIQVVVILRALFSVNIAFGWGFDFLFDISFTAWLMLFLLWGGRYAKVLIFGTKL